MLPYLPALTRRFAALTVLPALVACGSSREAVTLAGQPGRLDRSRKFLITVPPDGRYGETSYAGSGDATARALQRALMRQAATVEVGGAAATQESALSAARDTQAGYLIFPVITHWEDRATEWSGLPDQIEVVVSVFEVPTGQVVNRTAITGRSSLVDHGWRPPAGSSREAGRVFRRVSVLSYLTLSLALPKSQRQTAKEPKAWKARTAKGLQAPERAIS